MWLKRLNRHCEVIRTLMMCQIIFHPHNTSYFLLLSFPFTPDGTSLRGERGCQRKGTPTVVSRSSLLSSRVQPRSSYVSVGTLRECMDLLPTAPGSKRPLVTTFSFPTSPLGPNEPFVKEVWRRDIDGRIGTLEWFVNSCLGSGPTHKTRGGRLFFTNNRREWNYGRVVLQSGSLPYTPDIFLTTTPKENSITGSERKRW